MSFNTRRIMTPEESRKRKEREGLFPSTSAKPLVPPAAVNSAVSWTSVGTTPFRGAELPPQPPPLASNRLLAGYMAYEFLTKSTLLGQRFDKARSEAVPVGSADWKRYRPSQSQSQSQSQPTAEAEPIGKLKPHGYAEVAHLLMSNDAHIPSVVNPTQLARWIQM